MKKCMAVLALFVAVTMVAGCGGATPDAAFKDFSAKCEAKNYEAAYEHLNSATKKDISKEDFVAMMTELETEDGDRKMEFIKAEMKGDARAVVTFKDTDGEEKLVLLLEDGAWKIALLEDPDAE